MLVQHAWQLSHPPQEHPAQHASTSPVALLRAVSLPPLPFSAASKLAALSGGRDSEEGVEPTRAESFRCVGRCVGLRAGEFAATRSRGDASLSPALDAEPG